MERGSSRLAAVCAVAHTLLLVCYTFPSAWVPLRMRYWSQAYARVLFHQDWRLFAPDPPACGCSVEVNAPTDGWQPLSEAHQHFVWERMCANACRFAEASREEGDTIVVMPPALAVSIEAMAAELPRKGDLRLRMRRACAEDEIVLLTASPHR